MLMILRLDKQPRSSRQNWLPRPPSSPTAAQLQVVCASGMPRNFLAGDWRKSCAFSLDMQDSSCCPRFLRCSIIAAIFFTGAFIPLWILPDTFGKLSAGAFFVQFGVQGAWGVVPIYLSECSPAAYRASFGGIAYQLGNMISAAAAQIEARAGEDLRITVRGKNLPDYAKVQGILIGVVLVGLRK